MGIPPRGGQSHPIGWDNMTDAMKLDTLHVEGMSRSLLNIEKRSLPWLTLRGVGLASKNAVG